MSEEKWADIPGYEGWYQISDQGSVRSLDRVINQWSRYGHTIDRLIKGKRIDPTDNGNGYLYVSLRKNQDRKNFYVHRLVAEAFVDNKDRLPEVNHIDYDKLNNKASNLEWVDRLGNVAHSAGHMRGPRLGARLPKSGHKYVQERDGKYRLSIGLSGARHDRSYKTLQDALQAREVIMSGWQHHARQEGVLHNWSNAMP